MHELTDEMINNRQLYDSNGILHTYETDEEYEAALIKRTDELRKQIGQVDNVIAETNVALTGIDDMLERFATEHSVDYKRQFDDCRSQNETNLEDAICRFLESNSPSFPIVRKSSLIPQQGEVIHERLQNSSLYESISSSNTNLRFLGFGDLYITNKRFAFVFNSQVRSIPYRDIEVFTSDWVPDSGRIRVSVSSRARVTEFQVANVLKASFYYSYYTDQAFAAEFKSAGDLRRKSLQRQSLIDSLSAKAKDGYTRKASAKSEAVGQPDGTGCAMPFAVWLLLIFFVIAMMIIWACNKS